MRGCDKLFSASAFSNANGGGKVVNAERGPVSRRRAGDFGFKNRVTEECDRSRRIPAGILDCGGKRSATPLSELSSTTKYTNHTKNFQRGRLGFPKAVSRLPPCHRSPRGCLAKWLRVTDPRSVWMAIILETNSRVRFYQSMIKVAIRKISRARGRASTVEC